MNANDVLAFPGSPNKSDMLSAICKELEALNNMSLKIRECDILETQLYPDLFLIRI
jgi:hypothetical protein